MEADRLGLGWGWGLGCDRRELWGRALECDWLSEIRRSFSVWPTDTAVVCGPAGRGGTGPSGAALWAEGAGIAV